MTTYKIYDSYNAPQCGCEVVTFNEWWEVEDYLSDNPEVEERIANGYATIVSCIA